MAVELLGLLVGFALIFTLPVVVAWTVVRVVVTARETIEGWQSARHVTDRRGDTRDAGPTVTESETGPDAPDSDPDGLVTAGSESRKSP